MNLILSGRGVDLDERLRGYATEKLTRVERLFDRIIKMEVELRRERNPRVKDPSRVDVVVKTPGDTLRVHGEGADHFAAIDVAADRLEAQVRRFKGRLLDRKHHGPQPAMDMPDDDEPSEDDVIRIPQQTAKPLTVDEARLELESRGMAFLLFTEAPTMRPAVIYRRADGFGIVEYGG